MIRSIFTLILCCCLSVSSVLAETDKQERDLYRDLETFANVLTLIQQYYVDEVDSGKVLTGAINGMLSSLDPHSAYMTAEDFRALEEETSGSFTGIGVEISIRDGVLTAVTPIEGTPADRQGIQPGDQIVRINGKLTKTMNLMEAVKMLRGEVGTKVTITIHRKQWKTPKDYTLTREAIPLVSVNSMVLEPGYGYIRISNFQTSTTKDVVSALAGLRKKERLQGLILDLRNNPGGLLDQAVNVSDLFLDKGVIVTTKGRFKEEQMVFEAHPTGGGNTFSMVVLVNSGSASGSEIVAGALQDHKRAIILGTTTFGKGSVQTVLPLPEGAGLRLTTAKYYTPSGDSIQATGIKPDMIVPLVPVIPETENVTEAAAANTTIREKDLPNHLKNETLAPGYRPAKEKEMGNQEENFQRVDEIEQVSKRLEKDNQLRTALIILKSLDFAADQATD
ncbi:S41 family peptidase [Desulfobulbus rhabdoformis]|nr:S41 family peptidase [Desulfobulbus rhabdoformis]